MSNINTQSSATVSKVPDASLFSQRSTILMNGLLAIFCILWLLPIIWLIIIFIREGGTTLNSVWSTFISALTTDIDSPTISESSPTVLYGGQLFLNSLTITIPTVIIPFLIALFAAYAFVRMNFIWRRFIYSIVLVLLIVPVQTILFSIPRLNIDDISLFGVVVINNAFLEVWLVHIGFGLPLAIYFLTDHLQKLPRNVFERCRIDGASHLTIIRRIVLPYSLPIFIPFAVFQFIWVWNDLLISLEFLGSRPDYYVLNLGLIRTYGSGQEWGDLAALALLSIVLPIAIYFIGFKYLVKEDVGSI